MQLTRDQLIQIRQALSPLSSLYNEILLLDNNGCANACNRNFIELAIALGAKHKLECPAGGAFEALQSFVDQHAQEYIFGYLTYDLKNEIEELVSEHPDQIGFPVACFFVPERLLLISKDLEVIAGEALAMELLSMKAAPSETRQVAIHFEQRVLRERYIANVARIQQHIIDGDVYELNYCVEFFTTNATIDPSITYQRLRTYSPTPFGAFLKWEHRYLLCASPERFMSGRNGRLFSQPIKGTIRRGKNAEEEERLKLELRNSEKEQAENLMIVDLVRNDLARSSITGTVNVDELFGIYTFEHLHQMISTVSAERDPSIHPVEAIRRAFPMGSMTGAPKIKAMELIEHYEATKRGLYAGAVGYFAPGGDFDFNVVIRSLQYNQRNAYLSFEVGSAITYDSDPEQEYEECLLKAKGMVDVLGKGSNE